MADQCRHLKPCKAMVKFRDKHGDAAGDVGWKYCETCPLRTDQSAASSASPTKTPGFLEKTVVKG